MRIAQIIDDLNCGGAEQMAASLSLGLRKRGHEVTLICLREIGDEPVDLAAVRAAGVEILALNKPDGFHLRTLRALVAALRERRIDVVHTHNHLVHHYGVVAARLARVSVILNTLHGTASLLGSARWSRELFRVSCLLGHGVVAVSETVRRIVREALHVPEAKLHSIDNGIELAGFLAIERATPGVSRVFGTIGRLAPVKDHHNLLQAFALLRKQHPSWQLRILGDGPLMQDLQQLVDQLSLGAAVHFDGFSLDTAGFLAALDAYVISSRSEGLPLSLLEAMASGLPVVATRVGEIPAIVDRAGCGWLCEPESARALASAMAEATESEVLQMKGQRARNHVRERYSVGRMADEYELLYGRLARHQPGCRT